MFLSFRSGRSRPGYIRSGYVKSLFILLAGSASLVFSACGVQNSGSNSVNGALDGIIGGKLINPNINPNIVGGQPVDAGDAMARSVVALYDVQAKALCTASIVSPNYLITASHCVKPGSTKNLRVVFGTDISQKSTITAVGSVLGAVQSPLWKTNQNNQTNTGDFAIVRLAAPLPAGFVPATILTDASLLQDNAPVLLEGYGITTGHPDPKSTDDNGAGVLRSVVTTISDAKFSQSEIMIDDSKGKGACHGDSGGPAYVKDAQGKIFLFGVTSRGTDQFCTQGVVYTNIMAYVSWIPTAVKELEAQVNKAATMMMPQFAVDLSQTSFL